MKCIIRSSTCGEIYIENYRSYNILSNGNRIEVAFIFSDKKKMEDEYDQVSKRFETSIRRNNIMILKEDKNVIGSLKTSDNEYAFSISVLTGGYSSVWVISEN